MESRQISVVDIDGKQIAANRMKIVERAIDILRDKYSDIDWNSHSLLMAVVPKVSTTEP